jgi:hypothetical protein
MNFGALELGYAGFLLDQPLPYKTETHITVFEGANAPELKRE